jgi:hypothetical protein
LRALITALMCGLAAPPASAQHWSVDAQAGRLRSVLDPANTAFESAAIGLRYDQLKSVFRITAGVPAAAKQPLWASVAGSHRFAARKGSLIAGLDVAANGFVMRDRVARTREVSDVFQQPHIVPAPSQSGIAGALQALPVIGVETSKLQLHVRGGVSRYASEFAEQRRDRNVALADAQITFAPTPSLAVVPAVRHFSADEDDYTFGGLTAVGGSGPLSVWGSTGRWIGLDDQDITWAAGASLRVGNRATLMASGRRDVIDPLYGIPGQDAWNIGASVKLGRVPPSSVPVPAVFTGGQTTIRLAASQSSAPPRVAGDFTNWKPQPMQRSGDAWVYSVSLEPGVYNYAFVDAQGEWFVPEKHPGRKSDGMGGAVAVLVVR